MMHLLSPLFGIRPYTYNVLGEQTSMTDAAGNKTSYGYDATGQLTQVTLPNGQIISYAYNAAGDCTQVISGGTTTSYSSNADNEITQVGSATYTYDGNGNLHTVTDSSGTTTYTYNDLNQLVSITAPDGTMTTFQYSPLGFLVGENVGGTQTNYLVDPTGLGNVVASYNGSGSLIADYNYGLGLVSQTGPSDTGYYDFDASGNTIGITGSTGSYVNQYSYLPFGETTTVSAALPNPFTFAGQTGVMQISTNLFYMRARDYTPATGQFLSNDPTGFGGGDWNIRRYVENDPLGLEDPSGSKSQPGYGGSNGQGGTYQGTMNNFSSYTNITIPGVRVSPDDGSATGFSQPQQTQTGIGPDGFTNSAPTTQPSPLQPPPSGGSDDGDLGPPNTALSFRCSGV